MTDRADRLQACLIDEELEALIVTNPVNIAYLTGFTGSNGTVVVLRDSVTLITDSRYTEWATNQLRAHAPATDLVIAGGAGRQQLLNLVEPAATVGLESTHVTWAAAESFRSEFGDRLVSTTGLVEDLRELKSAPEVEAIADAASITDRALAMLVDELRPGTCETAIARRLAQLMFDDAGVEPSFDIIVASGPNAARPHHEPGGRVLETGDLVIIDCGATVDGYRSDMTRTFVLGPPSQRQHEMLEAVLEAQTNGVAAVGPGVPASDIDDACRQSLTDAGFGEYFTHGTGHGVGREIHEAPSVSRTSTATLTPGHVITVEPGIYIPDMGGVRWEDTVVVTENGSRTLTRSPKQPVITL